MRRDTGPQRLAPVPDEPAQGTSQPMGDAAESGRGVMWFNPGACEVCGWQFIHDQNGMWCRCTIQSRRADAVDEKLRAFQREWDELGCEGERADRARTARGRPPLGALIIFARDS